MPSTNRRVLTHVGIASAYVFLAFATTYPLVTRLTDHVPMPTYLLTQPWRHVYWFQLWSLWLAKANIGIWPPLRLSTNLIFHPVGVAIPWLVQVVSAAVIAVPLQGFLNVVAVGNVLILAALALTGYCTFLLALRITRDSAAAFLGGAIFSCAPIVLANAQGHLFVITGLPWIPMYLLFLFKTLDEPTPAHAAVAGLLFSASMLSYWYYAGFLGLFTLILAVLHVSRAETRRNVRPLIVATATFAAIVAPVALAVIAPFLLVGTGAGPVAQLQSSLLEMREWSVDLLAFFLPAYDHWLLGPMVRDVRASFGGNFTLQSAYLGFTSLALLAVAAARAPRSEIRPWAWCGAAFFFLALGPFLHARGSDPIVILGRRLVVPLPQLLVHWLPPFSGIRDLSMYVVPLMLSIAMLAALGVRVVLEGRGPRARIFITATAFGLMFAECVVLPFPVSPAAIPAPYQIIANDPEPVSVLELPLSSSVPVYQHYQTAHGKPLITGYLNRLHPWYEQFADTFPAARMLANPLDPGTLAPAARAEEFLRFFRIRYVVIHRLIAGEEQSRRLTGLVRTLFPVRLLADDGSAAWYRVDAPLAPEPLPRVIEFSPERPDSALKLGWSGGEHREMLTAAWVDGTSASAWIDVPFTTPLTVAFRVQPFIYPAAPPQTARLSVNGHEIGRVSLPETWSTQTLQVPSRFLLDGINRFDFAFGQCAVPATVVQDSVDRRCLSVAFDFIRIEHPATP